ncbi:MAG: hypothetical protein ACRDHD_10235 [Candidatus Limnocylindria bacterium]
MTSTRTLLAIAGGIAALLLLAVVVVVLAGNRQAQEFPPGTPEAAMQAYLRAWDDDDLPAAYAYFSADVRDRASLEEYQAVARSYGEPSFDGPRRAVYIDGVDGSGDRVTLLLTVEERYGDAFGGGSNRYERPVRMVREDGEWKIDEPLIYVEPAPFGDEFGL